MKRTRKGLAVAVLALSTSCHADADVGERRVTFGGFGTLGAVYHAEDGFEYRRSASQPSGARAGELDFATDSLAGVQVNAAWSRSLEAVVQGVTRLSSDNDWQPQLTRAFLRYRPNETLQLRAGRIGWEIYPRADSRDIGYSQLGIRPAVEVFGFLPTDRFDGGELQLQHPIGRGLANLALFGGTARGTIRRADGSRNDIDGSKVWGGRLEYASGPWILRLGSGVFELDDAPQLDALVAGLRQTGQPQALALADTFASGERRTLFLVAAVAYDEGPLQARVFLGRTESGEGVGTPKITSGQIIGGYDLGALTPYASFAYVDSYNNVRGTGLPDQPQFAALNAGAATAQAVTQYNQSSLALGLRYDFLPRLALKVQMDQVWMRGTPLVFEGDRSQSGEDEMTVFGAALDFIF